MKVHSNLQSTLNGWKFLALIEGGMREISFLKKKLKNRAVELGFGGVQSLIGATLWMLLFILFLLYMDGIVVQIPISGVCALLFDKCGRLPILMDKNRE